MEKQGTSLPPFAEALALLRFKTQGRRVVLASGADARGLVYALLELADRVKFAADPMSALNNVQPTIQQPANRIRSVARLFASDVEDKPWFNDRDFWQRYLTELVTQRFNRFHLTFGLGYDFTTEIRDAYFHFAYPFLVAVPGYDVRAVPLSDSERDHNLEMLRFISAEAARRGLHFQLGLWTHAYKWTNSPDANYVIEGLSNETHAAYCRDALAMLIKECPDIHGITFRIHGESGIAEGSYDFWKTVFDGVVRGGRRIEMDLHAKGIDEEMINLALATGMPVTVSPKFWAEHMGLGYMQGAIRPQEMPPRGEQDKGFFSRSTGSRRFLRYGYGDLLRDDRRYKVLHRIWHGTQRLLLWGDPDMASDYGYVASFCGSDGVEWQEPLSFKGRKGSGLPGGRNAYADESLTPKGGDSEKFLYGYRVLGRHLYTPICEAGEWRRFTRRQFGLKAPLMETALAQASRILPLITTAHCPSAANNNYWPEMYTNMAIVDAKRPHPYGDTLPPKRFGAVSPLDPEFFSRVDDFADALVKGEADAKISPPLVALELEKYASAAEKALAQTDKSQPANPEYRRWAADIKIQCGIGRFFAWKFRAAALFAIYEKAHYLPALDQAIVAYHKARQMWAGMAGGAAQVYRAEVTFGPGAFQRGHWCDRVKAIDEDIADMEKLRAANRIVTPAADPEKGRDARLAAAISQVLAPVPAAKSLGFEEHITIPSFQSGQPLPIDISLKKAGKKAPTLHLHFRHVNKGEIWQVVKMQTDGLSYKAEISADYTNTPFPLQYYFEVRESSGVAWVVPGLEAKWKGQPYYFVRQSA